MELVLLLLFLNAVHVIWQAGSEVPLSKKELLRYLLEGTAASNLENFDDEDINVAHESTSCSTSLGMYF